VFALSAPRVIISGIAEGVGKSLLSLGLCHEFRRRGVSVACAVSGPNLGQAILLRRIAGRYVHVLDENILSRDELLVSAAQLGIGADLVLIEGRGGLFDGAIPGDLRGSDAELSSLLRSPVVLVADTRGFGASVAALVKGYTEYAAGLQFSGVVLNRISASAGSARGRSFFEGVFSAAQYPPPLGVVPELAQLDVALPRLPVTQEGSLPSLARQFLVDVGAAVREHVNVERLLSDARTAASITVAQEQQSPSRRRCRIAVAEDACFGMCFQDNLDLLRLYGAEVVPFSPLADAALPKRVGAVYMPGACLSGYAQDLAANTGMLSALKSFAAAGGAIYGEGAGAAYLCSSYRLRGSDQMTQGAGVITEHAAEEPPRFGYIDAETCEDSILGRPGLAIKGISTGEWRIPRETRVLSTLRVASKGSRSEPEGWSPGAQILVSFNLLHFGSNPEIAKNLVENAEVVQPIS
jgi:cobyrinic acid a,c-diamide synthase